MENEKEQKNKSKLTDKEMLTDALSTQKYLTESYNTLSNECANPEARNTFMNILNDEHKIQYDIFDEMSKRGWYQVTNAEENQINEVKQQYSSQGSSN